MTEVLAPPGAQLCPATCGGPMSQGKDRIELEVGLKKAIQWIDERRRQDPRASTTTLIDEASRRFELSPIQADFLYRHFAKPS